MSERADLADQVAQLREKNAAYVEAYDLLAKQGKADNEGRTAAEAEVERLKVLEGGHRGRATSFASKAGRAKAEAAALREKLRVAADDGCRYDTPCNLINKGIVTPRIKPCASCVCRAALETK